MWPITCQEESDERFQLPLSPWGSLRNPAKMLVPRSMLKFLSTPMYGDVHKTHTSK